MTVALARRWKGRRSLEEKPKIVVTWRLAAAWEAAGLIET
jgi:hypothetical protein